MNINGGQTCNMTEAAGYAQRAPRYGKGGSRDMVELVTGVWSHAVPWPFEYNEDDIAFTNADLLPKFKEYKPVGIIKQAAACRLDYMGKGPGGGRKVPRNCIGAALRAPKDWSKDIDPADVCVRFTSVLHIVVHNTITGQLRMIPEIDAQGGA